MDVIGDAVEIVEVEAVAKVIRVGESNRGQNGHQYSQSYRAVHPASNSPGLIILYAAIAVNTARQPVASCHSPSRSTQRTRRQLSHVAVCSRATARSRHAACDERRSATGNADIEVLAAGTSGLGHNTESLTPIMAQAINDLAINATLGNHKLFQSDRITPAACQLPSFPRFAGGTIAHRGVVSRTIRARSNRRRRAGADLGGRPHVAKGTASQSRHRAVGTSCSHVAWLDCDIVFDRDDWMSEASLRLDEAPLVQLYDRVAYLTPAPIDVPPAIREGGALNSSAMWASFRIRIFL